MVPRHLEIGLMEQRGGTQAYWHALTHELAPGETMEFGVEDVEKFACRNSIAPFSLVEQRRDVGVGHIWDALARDRLSHFQQIVKLERPSNYPIWHLERAGESCLARFSRKGALRPQDSLWRTLFHLDSILSKSKRGGPPPPLPQMTMTSPQQRH